MGAGFLGHVHISAHSNMKPGSGHQPAPEDSAINTHTEPLEKRPVEKPPLSSGLTWRAAFIGLPMCSLLVFLDVSTQSIGRTSRLTWDGFGAGALFLLLTLILAVELLKRMKIIRSGMEPRELLVIFSMLITSSSIPTLFYVLLPDLAGFTHFSADQRHMGHLVAPLLPEGLTIGDQAAAAGFFKGLESGESVPYEAWVGPLVLWGVLLGVFYFTMMALLVIVRKRWIEQERIAFPMAQLPLSLIEGTAGERALLRNGVFWWGFAIPALIGLNGILRSFLPSIPPINLSTYIRFYRNSMWLGFYTNFLVLGISYLVSLEILGSILLFNLIAHVQIFLILVTGSPITTSMPRPPGAYHSRLHEQSIGALLVMVGFGLYEARDHLRDVFRKAFGLAPEVDDEDEMLSYQAAVLGFITGVAFICYWLRLTGISWWVVPIFVVLMLVTFLGVTRVLAETGIVLLAPLSPMNILINSAGPQMLGGPTMAGFLLAQPWTFPTRSHLMASGSTVLRLTHRRGRRSRPLIYVFFLALLIAGVTAAATMLHYSYDGGAYGLHGPTGHAIVIKRNLNWYGSIISDPSEGEPIRLFWSGVGAAAMGLLILARRRLFWWPFSPVGYVVGNLTQTWPWWWDVFLAWLVKRNVLKYGGPSLHGKARAFFLGLIMGEAVIGSVREILDLLPYLLQE